MVQHTCSNGHAICMYLGLSPTYDQISVFLYHGFSTQQSNPNAKICAMCPNKQAQSLQNLHGKHPTKDFELRLQFSLHKSQVDNVNYTIDLSSGQSLIHLLFMESGSSLFLVSGSSRAARPAIKLAAENIIYGSLSQAINYKQKIQVEKTPTVTSAVSLQGLSPLVNINN